MDGLQGEMTRQRLSQQFALWLRAQPFVRGGLAGKTGAVSHSLEAIEQAIKAGCGVVLEAQLTFDGDAIVFGEDTLDRLTTLRGHVHQYGSARLQGQKLGGSNSTIMSLSCLLPEIAGRTPVLIDASRAPQKDPLPLCFAIRRALEGYGGPLGILSPNPRVVAWFGEHARRVARGLLVLEGAKRTPWWQRTTLWRTVLLRRAHPDFCVFDHRALPSDFAQTLRRQSMPVLACSVRTAEEAAAARCHADNIIQDFEEHPIPAAAPAQPRPARQPVAAARP